MVRRQHFEEMEALVFSSHAEKFMATEWAFPLAHYPGPWFVGRVGKPQNKYGETHQSHDPHEKPEAGMVKKMGQGVKYCLDENHSPSLLPLDGKMGE